MKDTAATAMSELDSAICGRRMTCMTTVAVAVISCGCHFVFSLEENWRRGKEKRGEERSHSAQDGREGRANGISRFVCIEGRRGYMIRTREMGRQRRRRQRGRKGKKESGGILPRCRVHVCAPRVYTHSHVTLARDSTGWINNVIVQDRSIGAAHNESNADKLESMQRTRRQIKRSQKISLPSCSGLFREQEERGRKEGPAPSSIGFA